MKNLILAMTALAPILSLTAPSAARAADGSLGVCADLSAPAEAVVLHCRRVLADDDLEPRREIAVRLNLAGALLEMNRPGAALEAYDAAASLGSSVAILHVGRADALEALDRRAEAAESWGAARAAAPDSFDVLLGEGAFHLRGGAPEAALVALDAALAQEPDDPNALFNRGLALIALGRGAEAERDFTRLLTEAPNDAGAYHHRARARAGRDDAAAVRDFDKAIQLAPEWPEPWFRSGLLLDEAGQVEEANLRFRRAFELGEKDPWLLDRIKSFGG